MKLLTIKYPYFFLITFFCILQSCKKEQKNSEMVKREFEIDQSYSLKVNKVIDNFQSLLKKANSNFRKSEESYISIDSVGIILEINLNYLYADVDTSYTNYQVDSFTTYIPIYDGNTISQTNLFSSYQIISDSIDSKMMTIIELHKDIYSISINRIIGSEVPNGSLGIRTILIMGKGSIRTNLMQFAPTQNPIRYGFSEITSNNDVLLLGGNCSSNSGGGIAESASCLLTNYANINLSLQASILPMPGYKLSYISLPNQGVVQLTPLSFYNSDNPFYDNSNASLPTSVSNTTYPTEIFAHIGHWESQPIAGTFGSKFKGPCLNYQMLNYYLNKMPILAQRTKNQANYLYLSGAYPVQFRVTTSDHYQSGINCSLWPSSNTPPAGLAISSGYCPDGEHYLFITYKKAVIIYDPTYGK